MKWDGGVTVWERRIERRKPRRIARCGSLFLLEREAVQPFGKLGDRVSIGEPQFMIYGFEQKNSFIERIFKKHSTCEVLGGR